MILAAILLLGAQGWTVYAPLSSEEPRADLVAIYRQVLAANDHDHDGGLSPVEWGAMVDLAFPEQPRPGEASDNYLEVRAEMLHYHRRWDQDGDGLVSLDELVREPLASFDCMDSDGNQRLAEQETWSGMARCAATD